MGAAPKNPSWVVAAGVATVEALKDQVGLCRWNYAMRSIQQHAKNSMASSARPSGAPSKARKLSSGAMDRGRGGSAEAAMLAREAEKAENVVHLVCWGPN